MAKKQVIEAAEPLSENPQENASSVQFPLKLTVKIKGKLGDRQFEFELPIEIPDMSALERIVSANFNRKFAEFGSGLKSRGELDELSDEEVVGKFAEFSDRWLKGEKATRQAKEFSIADAAELVLVSFFRRQGASEKDAKEKAKAARKEGGELWDKALKKVQEDF